MSSPASQPQHPATLDDQGEYGSRHLSSLELARGVEVKELSLHDISNVHLQELVNMVKGWRLMSGLGERQHRARSQ